MMLLQSLLLTLALLLVLAEGRAMFKQHDSLLSDEDELFWGRNLLRGGSISMSMMPPTPSQDCKVFYASNQSSRLFTIDTETQQVTLINNPSVRFCSTEVEYASSTGELFVSFCSGVPRVASLDLQTGEILSEFRHIPVGALNGLEFACDQMWGTFVGMTDGLSSLVTVDIFDPVDGEANKEIIGPTGFGPISGLAYDGNVMWGVTAGSEERWGTPKLITIDLETGRASFVANLMIKSTGELLSKVGSIEFGPDGNLYGGIAGRGQEFSQFLVQINTTNGQVTPLFDTGYSITGLTCAPDPMV